MVRVDPRLSVNKLGEYLTCNAGRRRRILEDAKRPKDFIGPRFSDFYDYAPRYMVSDPINDAIIANAITAITARQPGSDWDEQNRGINIDLLGNLIDIPDQLPITGLTITALPTSQPEMTIEGVSVSVRPELLITGTVRNRNVVGAIKFYLPKSYPLDRESGEYIATTIHQYLSNQPRPNQEVDYRLCFVVDIPCRTIFTAPRSYARRRNIISDACTEIAVRWPTI